MKLWALRLYAAFSIISTIYLVHALHEAREERETLIGAMWNHEERILGVERLWGKASCQGNTRHFNP